MGREMGIVAWAEEWVSWHGQRNAYRGMGREMAIAVRLLHFLIVTVE
jgi:hypothetical protein